MKTSYFIILSFLVCGFLQELWCFVITKTKIRGYIVDVPNSRSSHNIPTPRAGGALFSLFAILSFTLLAIQGFLPWLLSFILSLTSLIIAIIGFLDDLKGLNARLRFFFQILVVLVNTLSFFFIYHTALPPYLYILTLLFWFIYSLSLINFYNFADGINGYIALQFLISTFTYLGYVYFNETQRSSYLDYSIMITLPIFSGLFFFIKNNMFKNSVFMGDTGSTFLGLFLSVIFFLSCLPMLKEQIIENDFVSFAPFTLLLTWIFFSQVVFLDCACMVIAKITLNIPFSKPHKLHLYQILSRRNGLNQTKTTLLLAFVQFFLNVIFIFFLHLINKEIFFIFVFIYLLCVSFFMIRKHKKSLKSTEQEFLQI